jgi:hypothetical protein
MQRGLEQSLGRSVAKAVASSIEAAQSTRLSGPWVPGIPEDLDLWPFEAIVQPQADGQIKLRLWSPGSVMSSIQPIDVQIVVTDPIDRTFSTDRRLNSIVERDVTSWLWPNEFTGGDIRGGRHHVAFFVAPISVGPSRQFGLVAEADFDYPQWFGPTICRRARSGGWRYPPLDGHRWCQRTYQRTTDRNGMAELGTGSGLLKLRAPIASLAPRRSNAA